MEFYSLEQVLEGRRDAESTLFITDSGVLSWRQFLTDVAEKQRQLTARPESRWALYYDELYPFAVGFFALLSAGKAIVLPSNGQRGTLRELQPHYDALLSDRDTASDRQSLPRDQQNVGNCQLCCAGDTTISLFTSGSTGEPKKIEKQLCHLSREIDVLETTFGGRMGAATIYATVSHHHIYGLLFKLLWPMCAGRVICSHFYDYPELLLREMAECHPAVLVSSPAQLGRMPHIVDIAAMQPHLRLLFSSGGPLSAEAALAWADQFGESPIEVLGSTETGGVAYRQRHYGEAWQAFESVKISRLPPEGLLHVDSPYLAEAHGFSMGDRIELLDENRFLLLGRADRIVKIEEKRVSLDEMERRLEESEWVAQAVVIKLDGQRRDLLAAMVSPTASGWSYLKQQGKQQMNSRLKEMLLEHFERVALPRKWRYVVQQPLNAQGKLTLATVKAMFDQTR